MSFIYFDYFSYAFCFEFSNDCCVTDLSRVLSVGCRLVCSYCSGLLHACIPLSLILIGCISGSFLIALSMGANHNVNIKPESAEP